MKVSSLVAMIAMVACCSFVLRAQASQTGAKVAVIDTEAFTDEKDGIKRLVVALRQVNDEFKVARDEIVKLKTRYDAIIKTINETQRVADPKTISAQVDEAETIKKDIERKQQDGQRALEKRTNEVTGPIYQDINNALRTFAQARGLDMLFDLSKMQGVVMVVNGSVDVTTAFIAEYNAKNASVPAGVPVKTP
jgi:Skp family chaperone for outer membrane proteins